ncbi:carboxypeptidase S [Gyrodon lividus]|nr:carboxypeptidase S [Gyrodon lividus]
MAPRETSSVVLFLETVCQCLSVQAVKMGRLSSLRGQLDVTTGLVSTGPLPPSVNSTTCPQWDALYPRKYGQLERDLDFYYTTPDFQMKAFMLLGLAVRAPTESFDDNGSVGKDPMWDTFRELHDVLEEEFPLIYKTLKVTKVNTHGLVFHWQGSTEGKPYILAAHQDVVPVEPSTVGQWKHAPFSGFYDGTWIWGRGSRDDKCNLISQLITVDNLLRGGFHPERTLVLAYGFDEEAKGTEGAGNIAAYLEKTYGRDSFALILDEGDIRRTVMLSSPSLCVRGCGHSSVPPEHTSIGLLSRLITAIEDNPHEPRLTRSGTQFAATQCKAAYAPPYSDYLRQLTAEALFNNSALQQLQEGLLRLDPVYAAMLGTTQAVDLIEGGVKVNALPERAAAVVNHRIAEHSSVGELQEHLVDVLSPIASKYDLTLNAFGKVIISGMSGQVTLTDAYGTSLEPAPTTVNAQGPCSPLYNTSSVVVAPSLVMDTRYYRNLTKHIIRMNPFFDDDGYNEAHTINEAFRGNALVEVVRFYTKFILNVDESDLL